MTQASWEVEAHHTLSLQIAVLPWGHQILCESEHPAPLQPRGTALAQHQGEHHALPTATPGKSPSAAVWGWSCLLAAQLDPSNRQLGSGSAQDKSCDVYVRSQHKAHRLTQAVKSISAFVLSRCSFALLCKGSAGCDANQEQTEPGWDSATQNMLLSKRVFFTPDTSPAPPRGAPPAFAHRSDTASRSAFISPCFCSPEKMLWEVFG